MTETNIARYAANWCIAGYQAAKNTCECDWLCDLSYSFNLCVIAYVVAAISAYTVCNQQ
jgi:hypothetical protein